MAKSHWLKKDREYLMKILRFTILSVLSLAICGCLNFNNRTNAEQLKFDIKSVKFDQNTFDCVILGGGIGGLTASIYMARSGYTPVIIQGEIPGGLITQSTEVENWPGEIKISGQDLANKILAQALNQNVQIIKGRVSGVNFKTWPYIIYLKSLDAEKITEIKCLSCIITMGTTPNFLQVPGECGPDGYFGRGVSTCAVCDGNLYRDKIVAVVGGGDSATTEALYLSKIAKKVYMIVRNNKLRANFANQQGIKSSSNIEILFETKITKINGDGEKVTSISTLSNKIDSEVTDTEKDIALDGVFLAIGSTPNTETLKNNFDNKLENNLRNQLELDASGYIKLFEHQETSRRGIFAAGDISDPKFKQAITAAGDSVKAALQAIEFLNSIGHTPNVLAKEKAGASPKGDPSTSFQPSPKAMADAAGRARIPDGAPTVSQKSNGWEPVEKSEFQKSFVTNIESEAQFKKILSQSEFVIADFYGSFCFPCQQMAPIFKKVAHDFDSKVTFVKIDVEKNSDITQKNSISSVPTFIIFKNGQTVKRFSGARDGDKLKQEINTVMAGN
jgi:thioredoxin reductase (NADPH)